MDNCKEQLQEHVREIAFDLDNGLTMEECPDCNIAFVDGECPECGCSEMVDGLQYLQDALDIEYIVNGKGEYLGARVLVAFGGPNIWINTRTKTVEGYWWQDSARARYDFDIMGLDEALSELWECR